MFQHISYSAILYWCSKWFSRSHARGTSVLASWPIWLDPSEWSIGSWIFTILETSHIDRCWNSMKVVETYWQSPVINTLYPCWSPYSPQAPETLTQCTAKSGFWPWRTLLLHLDRTCWNRSGSFTISGYRQLIWCPYMLTWPFCYHYIYVSNTFGIGPNFSMLLSAEAWIWACIHVGYPRIMACHYSILFLRWTLPFGGYTKFSDFDMLEQKAATANKLRASQGTRWSCGKNRPDK